MILKLLSLLSKNSNIIWVLGQTQCKRIFKGCEVRIETSVTRVTVRRHETRRVMPNSYLSDGIFNSHRATTTDSLSTFSNCI